MSNHERVWGTFVLPPEKYEEIKQTLFHIQQEEDVKLLSLAEIIYLKIKEPVEYRKLKQHLGESSGNTRNELLQSYIASFIVEQNPRVSFKDVSRIQGFILIENADGKYRIRNPKIIKPTLLENSSILAIGDEGNIRFYDEKQTLSVSIGPNNHAYSYAKKERIYNAFEKIMATLVLPQGFGGQLLYEGSYTNQPEVLKIWGPPPLTPRKQFKNSPY